MDCGNEIKKRLEKLSDNNLRDLAKEFSHRNHDNKLLVECINDIEKIDCKHGTMDDLEGFIIYEMGNRFLHQK
jgi:hypothetical protein